MAEELKVKVKSMRKEGQSVVVGEEFCLNGLPLRSFSERAPISVGEVRTSA